MKSDEQVGATKSDENPSGSEISKPLSASSKKPSNVKSLTIQILEMADLVKSQPMSEDELQRVKIYAGLVRTSAQLLSIAVAKARMEKVLPDLDLTEEG